MAIRNHRPSLHQWLPISAGLLAVFFWAASFAAIKFVLSEMQPITMIWLRLLVGVLTVAVLAWRSLKIPAWSDFPRLGAAGFVGVVVHQWLQANGMLTTTATVASWLSSLAPIMIVIVAWFYLRERLLPVQVAGMVVAAGGALLVSAGSWHEVLRGSFGSRGDWLVVASAVAWAGYTVMTKRLVETLSPQTVTLSTLTIGWLLLIPELIYRQAWVDFAGISWVSWGAIILLGVGSTGLAHLLYNYALQNSPAVLVAALQYAEPLIASGLAVIVLGEHFTLSIAIGGGLIVMGVCLVVKVRRVSAQI